MHVLKFNIITLNINLYHFFVAEFSSQSETLNNRPGAQNINPSVRLLNGPNGPNGHIPFQGTAPRRLPSFSSICRPNPERVINFRRPSESE